MSNSTFNPYADALAMIRRHPGTGSAASMAKLVLSLYNHLCSYSFGECVGNLDSNNTALAIKLVSHYAAHGETTDLQRVGKIVADELYPRLWQMGLAMSDARSTMRAQWEAEEQAAEAGRIAGEEHKLMHREALECVPFSAAQRMLDQSDGFITAYYFYGGDWKTRAFDTSVILVAMGQNLPSLTNLCPEMSHALAVYVEGRMYYVPTDYDARESYLATKEG